MNVILKKCLDDMGALCGIARRRIVVETGKKTRIDEFLLIWHTKRNPQQCKMYQCSYGEQKQPQQEWMRNSLGATQRWRQCPWVCVGMQE